MPDPQPHLSSTGEALQRWRVAERASAVARRGRLAAEMAARVASEAALAANATAEAARSALESGKLAEASASKTARLARELAEVTVVDLADAEGAQALAEVSEVEAQARYRQVTAGRAPSHDVAAASSGDELGRPAPGTEPMTADPLGTWRTAERAAAVARNGRIAAEKAVAVAAEAREAATATAVAAQAALISARLAEESASTTAKVAKQLVETTATDLADATTEEAMAEVDETEARLGYREAAARALPTPKP